MNRKLSSDDIGNIGENAFAAEIVRLVNCNYRKQKEVDIGVDGEIERVTLHGSFITKVQVKTNDGSSARFQISRRNLERWKRMNVPVVVVLVNLLQDRAYRFSWARIEELEKSAVLSSGKEKFSHKFIHVLEMSTLAEFKKACFGRSALELDVLCSELREVAGVAQVDAMLILDFGTNPSYQAAEECLQRIVSKVSLLDGSAPGMIDDVSPGFRETLKNLQSWFHKADFYYRHHHACD